MCANYTLIKVFFRKRSITFGHFCRGCARNSRGVGGVCGKTATRPARAGRQKNPRRRISGGGLAGEKGRQIAIQHPGIPGRSSGPTIKATRNLSPPPPSPPRTSPRRKTDSAPDDCIARRSGHACKVLDRGKRPPSRQCRMCRWRQRWSRPAVRRRRRGGFRPVWRRGPGRKIKVDCADTDAGAFPVRIPAPSAVCVMPITVAAAPQNSSASAKSGGRSAWNSLFAMADILSILMHGNNPAL